MYFIHEVERVINLHPSFFGHRIREYLTNQLFKDVEGTCDGNYYTICVVDIVDISDGKVVSGTGVAEYTIRFRCVVWKPFKGETVSICAYWHRTLSLRPFRSIALSPR